MSSLFSQGLTERPTKLKVVHTWTLDWYIVYTGIRLLMLIIPLFLHFSFSPNFKTIFGHTFLRNCEAFKVQTWYAHGQCIDLVFIIYNGLIYCCARWLERESWGIFTRKWREVCGPFCNLETNDRGLKRLDFATYNSLVLANTLGNHKPSRRWIWHSQMEHITTRLTTSWWRIGSVQVLKLPEPEHSQA